MPFWGRSSDHIGNYNFKIEIEGLAAGAFKAMEGLSSETDVIEFSKIPRRKRPGRHKWTNVVLKRGYVASSALWEWRKSVIDGQCERRAGSIVILADNGEEITRYNFFEAWPTKWKGFKLDAKADDVTVEELELCLERVEIG